MKQFLGYLVGLLLLSQVSAAQDSTTVAKHWDVHIMPTSLIDYNPRFRVGLEFRDRDMAYSLDVGIGRDPLTGFGLSGVKWTDRYFFFELRPEVKYFFEEKENGDISNYISLELFFIQLKDRLQDGHYHQESLPTVVEYDRASIRKYKTGMNVKVGVETVLWDRMKLEIYIGPGVAFRKISYSDVTGAREGDNFEEWFEGNYRREGQALIFNMALGVKVGYVFWNKCK